MSRTAASDLLGDRVLVSYFTLAFALSWAWWIPAALAGGSTSHFPGLVGPLLAAVVVTARNRGRPGLRQLLGRRGGAGWYAVALLPLMVGASAVVGLWLVGSGPATDDLSRMPGLPTWPWITTFAVVLIVNGLGEETGWRALAWQRLRDRHGLRDAALLLAVPWALWHLPLFWLDSGLGSLPPAVVPGWLVGLASGAVVLGWLYERSGSVAVVALAHTTITMMSGTAGAEGMVAATVSAAVIVTAVALLRAEARSDQRLRASRLRLPGSGEGH